MRLIFGLAVALLFASVARAGEYEDLCLKAAREGKCLVVIVTAPWCGVCEEMKRDVIEPMKKSDLKDAIVVVVDYDEKPEVARQVMRGDTLPQIVIFRFKQTWLRVGAIGKQSRSRIIEMLKKIKE